MAQREALTVVDFEQFIARPENRDREFELVDGQVLEKGYTEEHGVIAAFVTTQIGLYLQENPIARVAVSPSCRLPDDNYFLLQPDIAVFKPLSEPIVKKGAAPRMPDLVIEIESQDNIFKKMRRKANYYLEHGSQAVWLIYPESKLVEVHTRNAEKRILSEREMLDGGEVLPGFSVKIRAVLRGFTIALPKDGSLRVLFDALDMKEDYRYTYEDELFTGVAYSLDDWDQLSSEMSFVEGIKEGISRKYFPTGQIREEEDVIWGDLLRQYRSWYWNGQLQTERVYDERSRLIRERTWNEQGELIRDTKSSK